MDFLSPELSAYVEHHTSPESTTLKDINRYTQSHVLMPRMLSGHLQGRALAMFSKMIQPEFVLEIGTYTGYSAICLAEGLINGGKLITIDNNEELESLVQKHIMSAGMQAQIIVRTGEASQIIAEYNYPWDLVFIDADKENYLNYYHQIFDQVSVGGYIIADNVLWSGKILDEKSLNKDLDTKKIHEFNEYIQQDVRVENVLFPIRDGMMVIRKISN